ncbi:MAG: hypothetical protein IJD89_01055 [Clostridia bacterium]|nr:hypothetical protein [Clostridia bacterium]
MKKTLKLAITITLLIIVVLSICASAVCGFAFVNNIIHISDFSDGEPNMTIDYTLIFSSRALDIVISLVLILFFFSIAIGCAVAAIYIDIEKSDKKYRELEGIINSAYPSNRKK